MTLPEGSVLGHNVPSHESVLIPSLGKPSNMGYSRPGLDSSSAVFLRSKLCCAVKERVGTRSHVLLLSTFHVIGALGPHSSF